MKQDTPDSLLLVARREFARHGYDGASVRAITTAARANLGAITYHFGSKRSLYEKVLETAAQPLADAAVAAATGAGTPSQRVRDVVRVYFEYLAADPDVARLMLQELVLGRTPPATTAGPIRQIHTALCELVTEGQRTGEFRDGDPRLLAISIVSQPVHMNLIRRALKGITGIDMENKDTRELLINHVTDFACAGLARRNHE